MIKSSSSGFPVLFLVTLAGCRCIFGARSAFAALSTILRGILVPKFRTFTVPTRDLTWLSLAVSSSGEVFSICARVSRLAAVVVDFGLRVLTVCMAALPPLREFGADLRFLFVFGSSESPTRSSFRFLELILLPRLALGFEPRISSSPMLSERAFSSVSRLSLLPVPASVPACSGVGRGELWDGRPGCGVCRALPDFRGFSGDVDWPGKTRSNSRSLI